MLKMLVFQIKISEFGSMLYAFYAVTELDVLAKEINSAFVGLWRIRQFKRTNSSPIPSAKSLHKLSMSRLPFVSCKYSESNRKRQNFLPMKKSENYCFSDNLYINPNSFGQKSRNTGFSGIVLPSITLVGSFLFPLKTSIRPK